MKPAKELSAQLSARLAPADAPIDGKRGGSDYSKLRGIIRTQKDQIQALENEIAHFQARQHRVEDGHRLELARLKKEAEYHKRLRQAADQRSYELEDQLSRLRQQQHVAARLHSSHDDEKDGLIMQSQLLISKNSELTTKNKMLESQVTQLEELKAALEGELNQVYCERDELAAELERVLSRQHHQGQRPVEAEASVEAEPSAEAEAEGPETEPEAEAERERAKGPDGAGETGSGDGASPADPGSSDPPQS